MNNKTIFIVGAVIAAVVIIITLSSNETSLQTGEIPNAINNGGGHSHAH